MIRATLVLAIALAGCGGEADPTATVGYLEQYGGSAAVYDRIATMTDCGELQAEFDQAAENNDRAEGGSDQATVTLGYMTAADDRLEELGCYE